MAGVKDHFGGKVYGSGLVILKRLKKSYSENKKPKSNNESKKGRCYIKLAVCILSLPNIPKKQK